MKLFGLTLGTLSATIAAAVPALAQDALVNTSSALFNPFDPSTWFFLPSISNPASSVPEIDASSGLLAVAALLAALAFAWERKRRA